MKVSIIALALAAALAGCNGGSASPPAFGTGAFVPTPSPSPSASPTPRVVSAHLSWVGAAHSSSTSTTARLRGVLDLASPEPIEIGVAGGDPHSIPASSLETQATLLVTFTDSAGTIVAPPTGAPSVTIADPNLASPVPQPSPSASPSAGPVNVAQVNARATIGSTSATVTYPNGATSTIGVRVYADPALECPAGLHPGSVEGVTISSGSFATATSVTADLYLTGPACADKSTASTTLHAPQGFKAFAASVPIASITSALPFVPDGTTITVSALQASDGSATATLIVKGSSGDYAKFRIAGVGCNGSQSTCDAAADVDTVAAYGAGGFFPL